MNEKDQLCFAITVVPKEALNLLDEDIHRQQMRDAAALGAFYGAQSGRS